MSALTPGKNEKTEQQNTNVGRFLAKRGILLVKEFRDMMAVYGDYSGKLSIASLILSTAQSTYGDVQYGVKLEHLNEESEVQGSGFLDYDELDEIIGAFDFLASVAQQMLGQQRDYTEVAYSTKDNLKFGFYQSAGQQQGFIDVGGYGQLLFMSVPQLQLVRKSIDAAKQHLISRGAEAASAQVHSGS
jgi:hypothetical protein